MQPNISVAEILESEELGFNPDTIETLGKLRCSFDLSGVFS